MMKTAWIVLAVASLRYLYSLLYSSYSCMHYIAIAIKNVSCSVQELAFMYVFTVTIPRIDIGISR